MVNLDSSVKTPGRGSKLSIETTPAGSSRDLLSSPIFHSNTRDGGKKVSGKKRSNIPFYSEKNQKRSLPSSPIARLNPLITSPNYHGKNDNMVTSNDGDRKRLVDQFYDPANNESRPISKDPSSNELSKMLDSPAIMANELNFKLEDSIDSFPDKITKTDFKKIINNGGLEFISSNPRITDDEDLTNYILNIDRTFEEWQLKKNNQFDEEIDGKSLKPFRELLESIDNIITINSKNGLQVENNQQEHESLNQLGKLSEYLTGVNDQINVILHDFSRQNLDIKTNFRKQINDSINKLQDLQAELSQLELKLNKLRASINSNKTIISKSIPDKIKTLEIIEKRINDYSKTTNNKRYKNLNIILAILIVVISIYYGYR